jgi:hypothetical protein
MELQANRKYLKNIKNPDQFGCKFREKEPLEVVRMSF